MLKMIKKYLNDKKIERERKLFVKRNLIHKQITKFYEDLEISSGKMFLPPFMVAKQVISQYVKTDADVNRIYNNMVKCGYAKRI